MREVHEITSAGRSQSDQVRDRMIRYVWTMAIRMVCFILAVLVRNWWSLVLMIAAVLLPWIAVVYANSGAERRVVPSTYIDRGLPPGPEFEDKQNGQSDL